MATKYRKRSRNTRRRKTARRRGGALNEGVTVHDDGKVTLKTKYGTTEFLGKSPVGELPTDLKNVIYENIGTTDDGKIILAWRTKPPQVAIAAPGTGYMV